MSLLEEGNAKRERVQGNSFLFPFVVSMEVVGGEGGRRAFEVEKDI